MCVSIFSAFLTLAYFHVSCNNVMINRSLRHLDHVNCYTSMPLSVLLQPYRLWLLLLQEEVDAGAIIFQEAVPVKVGDTVETLSERVKEAEHRAFPAALQLVASGAVQVGDAGKICWK